MYPWRLTNLTVWLYWVFSSRWLASDLFSRDWLWRSGHVSILLVSFFNRLGPSVQAMTTFFHISLKSPWNVSQTRFALSRVFMWSTEEWPLHLIIANSQNIPAFDIRALMPQRLDEYFHYDGSLTAPPCYQSVLWTVFKNPVTISQAQVTYLVFCTKRPWTPKISI